MNAYEPPCYFTYDELLQCYAMLFMYSAAVMTLAPLTIPAVWERVHSGDERVTLVSIVQHLAFVPPAALFFYTPVVPPIFLVIAYVLALAVGWLAIDRIIATSPEPEKRAWVPDATRERASTQHERGT